MAELFMGRKEDGTSNDNYFAGPLGIHSLRRHFVDMERELLKATPVVALRRILSKVVIKKRASANRAERAAWSTDDLLFVSNYGEGEERRISFAHFSQAESRRDLPTLKVLGWDNLDTALHLDHVAETLTTRLAWPSEKRTQMLGGIAGAALSPCATAR